jgi:hypothetical protein
LTPHGTARAISESQSETRCSREAANEQKRQKNPAAATVFVKRVGDFNALYEVRRGQRKTDVDKARRE